MCTIYVASIKHGISRYCWQFDIIFPIPYKSWKLTHPPIRRKGNHVTSIQLNKAINLHQFIHRHANTSLQLRHEKKGISTRAPTFHFFATRACQIVSTKAATIVKEMIHLPSTYTGKIPSTINHFGPHKKHYLHIHGKRKSKRVPAHYLWVLTILFMILDHFVAFPSIFLQFR